MRWPHGRTCPKEASKGASRVDWVGRYGRLTPRWDLLLRSAGQRRDRRRPHQHFGSRRSGSSGFAGQCPRSGEHVDGSAAGPAGNRHAEHRPGIAGIHAVRNPRGSGSTDACTRSARSGSSSGCTGRFGPGHDQCPAERAAGRSSGTCQAEHSAATGPDTPREGSRRLPDRSHTGQLLCR